MYCKLQCKKPLHNVAHPYTKPFLLLATRSIPFSGLYCSVLLHWEIIAEAVEDVFSSSCHCNADSGVNARVGCCSIASGLHTATSVWFFFFFALSVTAAGEKQQLNHNPCWQVRLILSYGSKGFSVFNGIYMTNLIYRMCYLIMCFALALSHIFGAIYIIIFFLHL